MSPEEGIMPREKFFKCSYGVLNKTNEINFSLAARKRPDNEENGPELKKPRVTGESLEKWYLYLH